MDGAYYATAKTYVSPTTPANSTIKIAGGYNNAHSYDMAGSVNDFRVYDHTLSPKEVHELSKALIMHYKLESTPSDGSSGNLVANGWGGTDNWYIKTGSSYVSTDVPSIEGITNSYSGENMTLEYIPIDPTHSYTMSAYVKKNSSSASTCYMTLIPYDIDKNRINNTQANGFVATSQTTLSQDLNPGDTVVHLTDASGWVTNWTYAYFIAFFGYKDSTGYTYPDMVYTRNVVSWGTTSDKSHLDKTNNTVTLNAPYAGEKVLAGTTVAQSEAGSTYYYPATIAASNATDWTLLSATFVPRNVKYIKVARYVRVVSLSTYQWLAGITLTDNGTQNNVGDINLLPFNLTTDNYNIINYSGRTPGTISNGVYHVDGYQNTSYIDTSFGVTSKSYVTLVPNQDYYLSFYCRSKSAGDLYFGTTGQAYTGLVGESGTHYRPKIQYDLGKEFNGWVNLKIKTGPEDQYKIFLGFDGPNIWGIGSFMEFSNIMISTIPPTYYVPYNYSPLVDFYDYIQSTGTQWIDTGVKGYMNHTYEIDFQMNDTGDYRTWGALGQSSYIGYNMSFTYATNWCVRWNSTSSGQNLVDNISTKDTNRHTLTINNGSVYLDGVYKGISSSHNPNFSINYNLYLFTVNPAGGTPSTNSKCKIYGYRDIDANGNVVRNMVPCVYNDSAGMWDLVENVFYANKGTGTFTLGTKTRVNELSYDVSGYGNHGVPVGTFRTTPSPRYNSGLTFVPNSYIRAFRGGMVKDAITVSCWAYMDDWGSYAGRMLSCTEGGGWNFEPYGSGTSKVMNFACGTGESSNTYKSVTSTTKLTNLSSGWHHWVGTYDGFNTKIYLDGVLENTTAAYTTKTPLFYNASNIIFIGAEAGSNATTPAGSYFDGRMSDVRIYATALSADDVKELYDTVAIIDNGYNQYCYEFNENENEGYTNIKQTAVICSDLKERDGETTIYKNSSPNLLQGTMIDKLRFERTSGASTEIGRQFTPTLQLETGTYYTFSAMVRGSANLNLYTINTGGNVAFLYINKSDLDPNKFKLFSITFKVTGNRTINKIYPCTRYGEANTQVGDWYEFDINSIKLEEGTQCTPWIPASTDDFYRSYNRMLVANQMIEI